MIARLAAVTAIARSEAAADMGWARSETRSEGLEPPTFRSVARFEASRLVHERRASLLGAPADGQPLQRSPRSSRSVVSNPVSKITGKRGSGIRKVGRLILEIYC
jgi:hypothetical protein